jgi:ribosomal protein S18 acetylase RimI-like enzyme
MRSDPRAGVLARAFQDDPLFEFVHPDPERRRRDLPWLFGGCLRHAGRRGGVVTAGGGAAVAAWVPDTDIHIGPAQAAGAGMLTAPLRVGPAAVGRLDDHEVACEARIHDLVEPGFAYLWLVGVEPDKRGTGLGGEVVRETVATLADRFPTVALRTENEANTGLYRHLGFEQLAAFTPPATGLPTWIMARPTS